MFDLNSFYGPNAGYVLDLYERFLQDPASVDASTRALFSNWSQGEGQQALASALPVSAALSNRASAAPAISGTGSRSLSEDEVSLIVKTSALTHAIRERGHLGAHLDPLDSEPMGDPALQLETYGLTEADLAQLPADIVGGHSAEGAANALEAIRALRSLYSGTISYEFDQVKSPEERKWLRDAVGLHLYHQEPTPAEARKLLKRLTQVESFERYLHQVFPGQKRFSIEGLDTLVPMLDEIIDGAVDSESRELIIGMAHRGRLNVLAHVLEKPYSAIFSEFSHARHEAGTPLTDTFGFGWTGDVKYHLGAEYLFGENAAVELKIVLAPNPSHLEFVNPVIEGMTRAAQEIRSVPGAPLQDVDNTLPILIHGDAAFPGEGVVAETLNLWHLRGFWVGGTIHIIANNQLGFTTDPSDSRSTPFASDLAKGFSLPIIHVNADDPDACLTAVRIAHAYRDRFHKDIVIDHVGYRRWGHNEGDEPAFTQPGMYEKIRSHPSVREIYARYLEDQGVMTHEETEALLQESVAVLEQAKRDADRGVPETHPENELLPDDYHPVLVTPPALSSEQLQAWNAEMLSWPADFSPNAKLARTLQRRATALGSDGGIDWGHAEALAFASILADGTPIRLSGQDTERGTFSHRHAVLHNQSDGSTYIPLQHLSDARASFSIYNSPLSETAVLGFEYGYSVHAPASLVLWEAQFGDFANVAQVILDQFMSSGLAKWRQASSLILLLPHGYEGQGPEHSSARLERYLQLAAEENWRVANCSTAAQYFHLLRLQAANLQHAPRPLILMSPKSLLRHPASSSNLKDLVTTSFQPILDDSRTQSHPDYVRRILLCSGKIAIDLFGHERLKQNDEIALVRVEQLYPFPEKALQQVLSRYPKARELFWVQEEPRNMGAWTYIAPRLSEVVQSHMKVDVVSRPERSSPAAGFWDLYEAEQEQIIAQASGLPLRQPGGRNVR